MAGKNQSSRNTAFERWSNLEITKIKTAAAERTKSAINNGCKSTCDIGDGPR
jgi:hypothetical protein